jgi:hypothetical protein
MIKKVLFAGMLNPNIVILILTKPVNFECSDLYPAQNGSDPQSNT